MSFPIIDSPTEKMSLETVITRVAQHPLVDGIVLVGSTGRETLTPASDYDLLLILERMPAPLHVAVTTINGRLTDFIFTTRDVIEQILAATAPFTQEEEPVHFVHWQGDKAAIRYLQEQDPAFLELLQSSFQEQDRSQKVLIYEKLARLALGPAEGVWAEGTTAVKLDSNTLWDREKVEKGLSLWEELVQPT